ncbi:MAG TPA: hypothetical protein VK209_12720 [Candidatus Sulfotelmatobacter sp.]|nr:hypothetical protein [Candidatus Sulfotelmatobacter sp.]
MSRKSVNGDENLTKRINQLHKQGTTRLSFFNSYPKHKLTGLFLTDIRACLEISSMCRPTGRRIGDTNKDKKSL